MKHSLIKTALIRTIPVMTGYLFLGFGFGILLEKNGFGLPWALAMSLFIYAGSMQYVAVGLLSSGVSLLTAALTTLMVNARHLFYGISMIEPYRHAGKKKPYLIFALTDETYSLVCTGDCPPNTDPHQYCFLISLLNQLYWVTGSVLGSLAGSLLPFDTTGIDFAMTALFVTIFIEQWKNAAQHGPALIGLGASALCLLLFGQERFLIPSMLLITLLLTLSRPKPERAEKGGASHV